ncbi:neurexin-4-like [Amphiura filiformis]|uniref:neurexin-4-like n=1 Tax=Amphiura filiformis TaxID=82378 RepID=UPI003B21711B
MARSESIIHHDSESRGRVKGYKDKGDFVLTPNYLASSVEQMYRLIGVSEHCQQYIQYDCSKSKMWKGTSTDKAEAWWSTKDGDMMLNWGGVDTGKYGCSCYMNTECFNTGKVCNCDDDNIQWMTDGGQLDDKDSLPVYKVYHAHTENDERAGWHTLGPLLCSGMTNDLPMYRTCAELQRAGHVRNGSYLLDSDGPDAGDPPFVAYCDITVLVK